MRSVPDGFSSFGKALGDCLRAVRRYRRLDQGQVAAAIGVSRRSYVAIEGGVGRLSLDQIVAFADATNSDRFALVVAALLDKPSLAIQSADNKLMTIMMIAADDFETRTAGPMADLRPQEILSAFEATFLRLQNDLDQRQAGDRLVRRRLSRGSSGAED